MGKRSTTTRHSNWHTTAAGALTGLIAAGSLFAVAELASAFFGPAASPLASVGSTFIDFTPAWMKNFAIATFGTNDKLVLLISIGVAAAMLAAAAGVVARRKPRTGSAVVLGFAVVMSLCIVTRSGSGAFDLVPLLLGTAAGLWALHYLTAASPESGTRPGTAVQIPTAAGATAAHGQGGCLPTQQTRVPVAFGSGGWRGRRRRNWWDTPVHRPQHGGCRQGRLEAPSPKEQGSPAAGRRSGSGGGRNPVRHTQQRLLPH